MGQESGFCGLVCAQLWNPWEIWASKASPWSFKGRHVLAPLLACPHILYTQSRASLSLSSIRRNLRDRMRKGPVRGCRMQEGGEAVTRVENARKEHTGLHECLLKVTGPETRILRLTSNLSHRGLLPRVGLASGCGRWEK